MERTPSFKAAAMCHARSGFTPEKKEASAMKMTTIGIDLAKTVFQLHGLDDGGKPLLREKLDRSKMLEFFIKLPPCLIGMEVCGNAHYRRKLTAMGNTRAYSACSESAGARTA
jgi:hypothetical protein